ncbi:MAG TPA: ABC transporter ATP-binding protein [Solirubrobacterales bacterium]|nr:ABC transporter ATP-binding protein [Solirubrobacterales bacterium]
MTTAAEGIRLESVSKHYSTPAGPVRAVDGITLEVEAGTSLAITGPSGCGKSTLLGLTGGLEPPTSGRVYLGGREISSLSEDGLARMRRSELGLVFQADNLLPFLTAVENVGLQLALGGASDGYERCMEALAELGLESHADRLPDQLSGGQRQRVAVARALVHRPDVILADEPTGSLDANNSAAVIDLLLATREEADATLVVVTHDQAVARRLDRTLGLRDGRLDEGVGAGEPERRPVGV